MFDISRRLHFESSLLQKAGVGIEFQTWKLHWTSKLHDDRSHFSAYKYGSVEESSVLNMKLRRRRVNESACTCTFDKCKDVESNKQSFNKSGQPGKIHELTMYWLKMEHIVLVHVFRDMSYTEQILYNINSLLLCHFAASICRPFQWNCQISRNSFPKRKWKSIEFHFKWSSSLSNRLSLTFYSIPKCIFHLYYGSTILSFAGQSFALAHFVRKTETKNPNTFHTLDTMCFLCRCAAYAYAEHTFRNTNNWQLAFSFVCSY